MDLEVGHLVDVMNNEKIIDKKLENFDIRLPASHSYLQSNELGEISAEMFNFFEPGKEITVPLVAMKAVLLPSQSLPLKFNQKASISFIRQQAKKHSYFCLATINPHFDFYDFHEPDFLISFIGTLFQIKNLGTDDNHLTIQAIGRQRCRILRSLKNSDIFYNDSYTILSEKISVLILEDITIPSSIYCPDSSFNKLSKKLKTRYYTSLFHNDPYAIEQLSTEKVIHWLKAWLKKWYDSSRINIIHEQGYSALSYWVAANLPVDLYTKLKIFETECANQRLRMEWHIVSKIKLLTCIHCDEVIFNADDVINLSVEGNGMHFVNPDGFVFDLFTVSKVHNAVTYGSPSNEFSWFPNYSWIYLKCSRCSLQIGWYYTSSKFLPKSFYGINRCSIKFATFEEKDFS